MQLRRLPRCCCWVGVGLLVKGVSSSRVAEGTKRLRREFDEEKLESINAS
jgi:hypothetical protein